MLTAVDGWADTAQLMAEAKQSVHRAKRSRRIHMKQRALHYWVRSPLHRELDSYIRICLVAVIDTVSV